MFRGNDVLGQDPLPARSPPKKTVGLFHERNQSSIVYGSISSNGSNHRSTASRQHVSPKQSANCVKNSISDTRYPEPKSKVRRPHTAYNHEARRKSWVFDQSTVAHEIRNSVRLQPKTSKTFASSALPTERSIKEEQSKQQRPQTTGGSRGNLGSGCSVLSEKPSFDFCSSDKGHAPRANVAVQRQPTPSLVTSHSQHGNQQQRVSAIWSSGFKASPMSPEPKKSSSKITKSTVFDKDSTSAINRRRSKTNESSVFKPDPPAPKPVTSSGSPKPGSYQHNKAAGTTSKINNSLQSVGDNDCLFQAASGSHSIVKVNQKRLVPNTNKSTVFAAEKQAPVKTRNVESLKSTAVTQVLQEVSPGSHTVAPIWSSDFKQASMSKPGLQRPPTRTDSRVLYGSES